MINYDWLYQVLESKVNEGIEILEKKKVGESNYEQTLSDLITTANLVKTFGELVPKPEKEKGIKEGDTYVSFNGDKQGKKIVIFTSNDCSYCEAMKPVYLPYLKNTDLIVENINISEEKYKDFIEHLGIHGVPTFLLVEDAEVKHRFEGYDKNATSEKNLERLVELIKTYL